MQNNNLFSEYIGGGERGCGRRIPDALYLSVATSPTGKPIEAFVIDPPIPYNKFHRSPLFVWNNKTGAFDVVMYVGKQHYPMPWDFLEEARWMGISKRIPKNIDFEKITPYKSRLILVHKNVIPEFNYSVEKTLWLTEWCSNKHIPCTFALRDLGVFVNNKKHEVEYCRNKAIITTPSVQYAVHYPILPENTVKNGKLLFDKSIIKYKPGIFAIFLISHLEYVSPELKVPKDLMKKAEKAGINIKVMKE